METAPTITCLISHSTRCRIGSACTSNSDCRNRTQEWAAATFCELLLFLFLRRWLHLLLGSPRTACEGVFQRRVCGFIVQNLCLVQLVLPRLPTLPLRLDLSSDRCGFLLHGSWSWSWGRRPGRLRLLNRRLNWCFLSLNLCFHHLQGFKVPVMSERTCAWWTTVEEDRSARYTWVHCPRAARFFQAWSSRHAEGHPNCTSNKLQLQPESHQINRS